MMELTGNLKSQVETANSKEEAKTIIENAGMKLTDDELDAVAGGAGFQHPGTVGGRDQTEMLTFDAHSPFDPYNSHDIKLG
jgi:hypothetical protein